MPDTWVVVADGHVARLFVAPTPMGPLHERRDMLHPRSRLPAREINSDRPGRTFNRVGDGPQPHPMSAEVDPHRAEVRRFAREIAAELETARKRSELSRLVIVADPRLLGELRECMSPELRRLTAHELAKNLVHDDPDSIRSRLPRPLWSELA